MVNYHASARALRSFLLWWALSPPYSATSSDGVVVVMVGRNLVRFRTGVSYAISFKRPHGASQLWFRELWFYIWTARKTRYRLYITAPSLIDSWLLTSITADTYNIKYRTSQGLIELFREIGALQDIWTCSVVERIHALTKIVIKGSDKFRTAKVVVELFLEVDGLQCL